jgi:Cytochrome P460
MCPAVGGELLEVARVRPVDLRAQARTAILPRPEGRGLPRILIKAFRDNSLPFPDGTIIARLAYKQTTSEENNKALGHLQSFVAGPATNLEFMVKDSKKYAATGGWGFAQFTNGKPDDETLHKACFGCHALANRDFVFTHYSP